eukprot:1156604_1
MEHITHFNDDLNGNKHAEYTNFEFVWVKLRFTKQQRTQTQITCCWWPAQISLPFDQETTADHKKITVQLCTARALLETQRKRYVFQFKRERIIPFKHLFSQKNLKIFKYVVQHHLDPLLLTHYNLHWLLLAKRDRKKLQLDQETHTNTQYNSKVNNMALKKRQRVFYRQYKSVVRMAYDAHLKRNAKSTEMLHFNHCIHWMGDETVRYKKAQIVLVKGGVREIVDSTQYKQDMMAIAGQLWWPGVVLNKAYPLCTEDEDDDTVLVHLVKLNIQCTYVRVNVIPITRQWFSDYDHCAPMDDIVKLAEQMLLTARCGYELHAMFEKTITKIRHCSFDDEERCYHRKEWERAYEKCKSYAKKHNKAKKKKRKRKDTNHKKIVMNLKKEIYGKTLTSGAMRDVIIHKKTNRTLWNFCTNKISFKWCIHNAFHPLQLSFYVQEPPEATDQRKQVKQYQQAMVRLSKIQTLKQTFAKNLTHRLFIRQNTEICSDVLYFNMVPLMVISTNCSAIRLHDTLAHQYHALSAHHHPRILSRSSLLPCGTATKAHLARALHRKGWFVIWYLRWIRLLQYHMQCRCYDLCIQIIALLLPVALREFNIFVHETEFIIKCTLFILNHMDDEYRRKKRLNAESDIVYDNHHVHAIHNLLDSFHEDKRRGWKLSCCVGRYRFERINERLDIQKIAWFVKQTHFQSTQTKEVLRDKSNKNNCDVQFLSVLSALLHHKHCGANGNEQNTVLEALNSRSIVSTRSRRKKRKRKARPWDDSQIQRFKKQKLMSVLEDDYAADAEDETDDEVPPVVEEEKKELTFDTKRWEVMMDELDKCFGLNPMNDCYLFVMFQLLSRYKPIVLQNERVMKVYGHMKRFIELQSDHPNGYRYMITFLFKYWDLVPQTTEMLLQQILDYLIQLIHLDPLSRCIDASFCEMNGFDVIKQNVYFGMQFVYIKLMSVMNVIETGEMSLEVSKWKRLRKVSKEIQRVLSVNQEELEGDVKHVLHGILSMISDKNMYWRFMYFNAALWTNDNDLWLLKRQCCVILYGDAHPFIKEENNGRCITDLCVDHLHKHEEKESEMDLMHYGKVCVFEPAICCTSYSLQYSMYCNVLKPLKILQNMQELEGMYYDRTTPWNDKHKHQLFKYKRNILQPFNHQMRTLCFMLYRSVLMGSYSQNVAKNKAQLIDSCWTLMKKLNTMDEFVSKKHLIKNDKFVKRNKHVLRTLQIK